MLTETKVKSIDGGKMIRKIIRIDKEKCNGCGACATACHEGAIDIINGKAELVREHFCDGLGDCLPECPTGAISFEERECVVFGKGDKERMVYFDARTKLHLQNYLDSRTDNENALFVSLKAPYKRMKIGGIEVRLREMGKRLNIDKVHPHKFRRTLATVAIDKGMPIEQLQKLLGHQRIDTTLQYAMVKQSNVKIAHRKYIG